MQLHEGSKKGRRNSFFFSHLERKPGTCGKMRRTECNERKLAEKERERERAANKYAAEFKACFKGRE